MSEVRSILGEWCALEPGRTWKRRDPSVVNSSEPSVVALIETRETEHAYRIPREYQEEVARGEGETEDAALLAALLLLNPPELRLKLCKAIPRLVVASLDPLTNCTEVHANHLSELRLAQVPDLK